MSSTEAPAAYTVNEYCKRERISRSKLYKEWGAGNGPRWFYRGARRLITPQAADEYRQQLEAASA